MLNSKVLSCFSGVIMSIRSFFLLYKFTGHCFRPGVFSSMRCTKTSTEMLGSICGLITVGVFDLLGFYGSYENIGLFFPTLSFWNFYGGGGLQTTQYKIRDYKIHTFINKKVRSSLSTESFSNFSFVLYCYELTLSEPLRKPTRTQQNS